MRVGYIKSIKRESAQEQSEILIAHKCTKIYQEISSCNNIYSREVLHQLIQELQKEDTLVVTKVVVCANSIKELYELLEQLKTKEIIFDVVEQQLSVTEQFMEFLDVLAEFEENVHYQRQADGIAKALKRGVQFGRRRKLDIIKVSQAIELKEQGITSQEVANRFDVGKSTLLRYISEWRRAG